MPPQPVDATPSAINRFSKGGVYDTTETGEAFLDPADRHVEPLEGGAVVARDRASLRQGPCVDSVYVVAARRDRSGSPSALAAYAYAAGAGGHLPGKLFLSTSFVFPAALVWAALYMFTVFRLRVFSCPRCHKNFFAGIFHDPVELLKRPRALLGKECVHCGLQKFADTGS